MAGVCGTPTGAGAAGGHGVTVQTEGDVLQEAWCCRLMRVMDGGVGDLADPSARGELWGEQGRCVQGAP